MDGMDRSKDTEKSTGIPVAVLWGMSIAALGCLGLVVALAVAITAGDAEGAYTVGITFGAIFLLVGAWWAMAARIVCVLRAQDATVDAGELWHAQQYQALSEQHERIDTHVCKMVKGLATSVADQLRAELSEEIAKAVRAAHSAGYIAGVAVRQAASSVNGSNGSHLRLLDPENRS